MIGAQIFDNLNYNLNNLDQTNISSKLAKSQDLFYINVEVEG